MAARNITNGGKRETLEKASNLTVMNGHPKPRCDFGICRFGNLDAMP
jgi:hypothetical protein